VSRTRAKARGAVPKITGKRGQVHFPGKRGRKTGENGVRFTSEAGDGLDVYPRSVGSLPPPLL